MTEDELQTTCDSCGADVRQEGETLVCSRDAKHDIYPLQRPSSVAISYRDRPCATCGGRVVSAHADGLSDDPGWCRVDPSHEVG